MSYLFGGSGPQITELGIDTLVMNNDNSKKREGNEVTHKRKKGLIQKSIKYKV